MKRSHSIRHSSVERRDLQVASHGDELVFTDMWHPGKGLPIAPSYIYSNEPLSDDAILLQGRWFPLPPVAIQKSVAFSSDDHIADRGRRLAPAPADAPAATHRDRASSPPTPAGNEQPLPDLRLRPPRHARSLPGMRGKFSDTVSISTMPKRFIREMVVAAISVLAVAAFYAGPPRYWRLYVGQPEAAVVTTLGKPAYDSRIHDNDTAGHRYTLSWYYGFNHNLTGRLWGGRSCNRSTAARNSP